MFIRLGKIGTYLTKPIGELNDVGTSFLFENCRINLGLKLIVRPSVLD